MTKILTMGKSTQDVFLRSEEFDPKKEGKVAYTHLPLGAKLNVEEAIFSTGGNAMNAAVTFARHNLETSIITQIGGDTSGRSILRVLDEENIATQRVKVDDSARTSYSAILLSPDGERTILNYRGSEIDTDIYKLPRTGVDWLYLSSLNSFDTLLKLLDESVECRIKVAFNPGDADLEHAGELVDHIKDIFVFIANKEEYQMIFGGASEPKSLIKKALARGVNYAILTDGPNGSWTSDSKELVRAGMYEDLPPIDRTGAGDAFASGFTASLASGKSMAEAVTFASANSTSVVTHIGAKDGILKNTAKLHDMPLQVEPL